MDAPAQASAVPLEQPAREFYLRAMAILDESKIPYLVGGGYALAVHAGIQRATKDMDLFVRQGDHDHALDALAAAGYRTERTFHFLGKALHGSAFVDILYTSGNGLCPVDDDWFSHARQAPVLGRLTLVCPVEEMIWCKTFVQERDRFDGADVAHLLLAGARDLNWPRLLHRFVGHERVLLAHLVLFGYIYPSEMQRIPEWVMEELIGRMRHELPAAVRFCRGTFFSHNQYATDIQRWGYVDARLAPLGPLSPEAISTISKE